LALPDDKNRTTVLWAGLALLALGASVADAAQAQQPASSRPVARITGVQGNVLVSQADGMAAATSGQPLPPGARIITTAGAKATISYERGCVVDLGENRRYIVREAAECVAAKAPPLGAATPFAVLAGPQVVNTGATIVRGELGVSPGKEVLGFPGGKVIDGTIQTTGDAPGLAQRDAGIAYTDLVSQQCNTRLSGQDLGGQTLTPGVYCFPGAATTLNGELVLDAQGDPDAVFVFQVGTTLTTGAKSSVRVANSGQRTEAGEKGVDGRPRRDQLCHVYWQVGDSATLGRDSTFIGTIIAQRTVSVGTNTAVDGRALARAGAVTLGSDAVEIPLCAAAVAYRPGALGMVGTAAGGAILYEVLNQKKSKSPN
jgi:hypothetical protein